MFYLNVKMHFASVLCFLFASISVGQVIENDAVLFETPGDVYSDVELSLTQSDAAWGLFGFAIADLGNDQFEFGAFGIAEAYALFFAEPGDLVTPDFVSSTTPFSSNFGLVLGPPDILTLAVGESVFLSYWDDRSAAFNFGAPGTDIPDSDDNYGWLELGRSDRMDGTFGELEILGGATAIGQGIIVGTTTTVAIPEPSPATLLGISIACNALLRRKR